MIDRRGFLVALGAVPLFPRAMPDLSMSSAQFSEGVDQYIQAHLQGAADPLTEARFTAFLGEALRDRGTL